MLICKTVAEMPMILRRLADAVREQNWFTVVIEFVVVVAGIFVGLQVDGWKQARNDRALEHEYVLRLAADIQTDIGNILSLEKIFETKAMTIRDLRDLPVSEFLDHPPNQLMQGLDHSSWKALPAIQSATFTELASSGRLALIKDVPLRAALSNYYLGYQMMADILAEPIGEYRRLFHEAVPGDFYFDWRLAGDVGDLERLRNALDELRSDSRFEAAANAEIAYATQMIFFLRRYREQAEGLVLLLQL